MFSTYTLYLKICRFGYSRAAVNCNLCKILKIKNFSQIKESVPNCSCNEYTFWYCTHGRHCIPGRNYGVRLIKHGLLAMQLKKARNIKRTQPQFLLKRKRHETKLIHTRWALNPTVHPFAFHFPRRKNSSDVLQLSDIDTIVSNFLLFNKTSYILMDFLPNFQGLSQPHLVKCDHLIKFIHGNRNFSKKKVFMFGLFPLFPSLCYRPKYTTNPIHFHHFPTLRANEIQIKIELVHFFLFVGFVNLFFFLQIICYIMSEDFEAVIYAWLLMAVILNGQKRIIDSLFLAFSCLSSS